MSVQLDRLSPAALAEPEQGGAAEPRDPSVLVYRTLHDAILEQRLAPGTKLGEEQLAEIFQVSRPVVRRALARLSFERVVEIKPNRGAFIANPTVAEAHQVFEARRAVEEAIIRLCTRNHSRKDLAKLRRHVEIELEAERKGERVRWIRLTGEFHIVVARAAGNAILTGFLEDLVAQTSLIIGLYGSGVKSLCCESDHTDIVEAIASGDERAAVAKMLRHLQACEASLDMTTTKEPEDLSAILIQRGR
jgi:DNA-binding GntR family transcriptional regulator